MDYIPHWEHNGYWLFNSLEAIQSLAHRNGVDVIGCQFFFYEAYENEYDDKEKAWKSYESERSFNTQVVNPKTKRLEGYDVVTFAAHTSPVCSPLSCNRLAELIPINNHCLIETFEEAKSLIESGGFNNSEPGPLRIFAVYSVTAT